MLFGNVLMGSSNKCRALFHARMRVLSLGRRRRDQRPLTEERKKEKKKEKDDPCLGQVTNLEISRVKMLYEVEQSMHRAGDG